MNNRISSIVPLFLITILSVTMVEALYQGLEYFVFKPSIITLTEKQQVTDTVKVQKDAVGQKPDYRVIIKRNLFSRPESAKVPEKQVTEEETVIQEISDLGIVLMGTISGSDNSRRAIILTKKTRDQELFSTGEVVEGALIKEIQRGKLVLSVNGKNEILDMTEAAQMRPAYKAPKKSPASNSARPANIGNNNNKANVSSAPVPRRRVVRRPRATGNTPRPSAQ